MKTIENYEVIKVKPYEVNTSIYLGTKYSDKEYENGFSGVVKNPDLDDRFTCLIFCIWNSTGYMVYNGKRWGLFKHYKLLIN